MQVVDYYYFSTNYPIYYSKIFGNSTIFEVNQTLVKQPKDLSFPTAHYTKKKLENLKNNSNDLYVPVLELYMYWLYKDSLAKFFAYSMPKLEDNMLNNYQISKCHMQEKNELLLKINDHVIKGNKEGIYNHDIWLRNFHLNKDGKITGLDVDSLAVGNYKSDTFFQEFKNAKYSPKMLENLHLQNISMLKCCLNLWCSSIMINLSFCNYQKLIERLDIDSSLKQMMFNVLIGEDVDMHELISHMPNKGIYLKRSR